MMNRMFIYLDTSTIDRITSQHTSKGGNSEAWGDGPPIFVLHREDKPNIVIDNELMKLLSEKYEQVSKRGEKDENRNDQED